MTIAEDINIQNLNLIEANLELDKILLVKNWQKNIIPINSP